MGLSLVLYLNLEEALSLSVFVGSSLSGVIYLQWLPFHHLYPVPMCKLSEDMPHQNFPFCSSMQLVGPDLNIMLLDLCL